MSLSPSLGRGSLQGGREPRPRCSRSGTLRSRVLMGGGVWGVWDWGGVEGAPEATYWKQTDSS